MIKWGLYILGRELLYTINENYVKKHKNAFLLLSFFVKDFVLRRGCKLNLEYAAICWPPANSYNTVFY